jgi:hypothetical protein
VLNQLQNLKWRPDSVCIVKRAEDQESSIESGAKDVNPVEVLLVCFPADGPRNQVFCRHCVLGYISDVTMRKQM